MAKKKKPVMRTEEWSVIAGAKALAREASGVTGAVKKALSRGTEGYGGEGWKKAKRASGMEVRHPESRKGKAGKPVRSADTSKGEARRGSRVEGLRLKEAKSTHKKIEMPDFKLKKRKK